jgi:hypothetical protein
MVAKNIKSKHIQKQGKERKRERKKERKTE